jgi:hypothetical protein
MFSGAYLILNVEHEIIANYASTSFTGVRILKYPVPYVTDFASISGIKSSIDRKDGKDSKNRIDGAINAKTVAYADMNELEIDIN